MGSSIGDQIGDQIGDHRTVEGEDRSIGVVDANPAWGEEGGIACSTIEGGMGVAQHLGGLASM